MLLDFSKASLIGKAQQQPDKVKETIEKAKNDGICLSTLKAINSSLDQSIPLWAIVTLEKLLQLEKT